MLVHSGKKITVNLIHKDVKQFGKMEYTPVNGTRLPDGPHSFFDSPKGAYWKDGDDWFCVTPSGHYGILTAHTITEHEDGTITVHPSIGISYPGEEFLYHGWLKNGIWEDA